MTLNEVEREILIRQIEQTHEQYVSDKLNCAERTFLTIHGIIHTDIPDVAVSILTGFGGGVGGSHQSICGAVTGSVAALDLIWGRRKPAQESSKKAYEVAQDFFSQFRSKFGTEICGELIGDLLRINKFNSDERRERCFNYCDTAIKICVEFLTKYEKL